MKKTNIYFNIIKLPIDIIVIIGSFALAYYIRSRSEVIYLWPFSEYIKFVIYFLPIWILVFAMEGLYNIVNPKKGINEFYTIIVASSTCVAIMIMWLFLSKTIFFSRLIIIYSWALTTILVFVFRSIVKSIETILYKNKIGIQKVVIVGGGKMSENLIKVINAEKSLGYELQGIVSTPNHPIDKRKINYKLLGDFKQIHKIYKEHKFDILILTDPNIGMQNINFLYDYCDEKRIFFKEVPNLLQVKTSNAIYSTIGGIPIINFRRTPIEGWGSIIKRLFDILISILLIIIFSPVFLITAIAIKLDSKGPVLFVYKRIGRDGKPFTYFKFRSMVQDAHKLRYDKNFRNKVKDTRGWNKSDPMIKFENDPRITRVGRFIRKYSIDELPEFILVFLGRMSMVGPRPHEKEEVEKYQRHHKKVLTIKPGITGMAQVSGRSDLSFDDEVRLDTYYIENWSPWLDIKILFKTPLAVLQKRKAL